ncbi:MAG: hypothetical protein HY770_03635 [Chitinivibrionia bacterium]|nr:hypothetical protein [Chitinivibrionia bacterium]
MGRERRGVTHIHTMAGLVDGRRARSPHGALLELSMLELEKVRLTREMQRADRRCADIRKRLAEIDAKQHRLQRFVEEPHGEAQAHQAHTVALPLPIHSAPTDKLKKRRLCY